MQSEITVSMEKPEQTREVVTNILLKTGFKAKRAIINYSPYMTHLFNSHADMYPLNIVGELNGSVTWIKVHGVTAGDKSETTQVLADILKCAQLPFNEEDVFYEKRMKEKSGFICFVVEKG